MFGIRYLRTFGTSPADPNDDGIKFLAGALVRSRIAVDMMQPFAAGELARRSNVVALLCFSTRPCEGGEGVSRMVKVKSSVGEWEGIHDVVIITSSPVNH